MPAHPIKQLLVLQPYEIHGSDIILIVPTGFPPDERAAVLKQVAELFDAFDGVTSRAMPNGDERWPWPAEQVVLLNHDADSAEIPSFDAEWAARRLRATLPVSCDVTAYAEVR